jgi:hypothetical protein
MKPRMYDGKYIRIRDDRHNFNYRSVEHSFVSED